MARREKDTSAKQPVRATGKYTRDNNLHLHLPLFFFLSVFIATYSTSSSFLPSLPRCRRTPPFTSLCVVVATPRPPHYNACVFVSGVAALPPLVSPFFSLSLCPFEIESKKKKKKKQGQRTGESRRRRRRRGREGGKGGRFVGEGRGRGGGMQELEQSFSISLSCFYLSSELLSTFPFVSEVAGCSPLL